MMYSVQAMDTTLDQEAKQLSFNEYLNQIILMFHNIIEI